MFLSVDYNPGRICHENLIINQMRQVMKSLSIQCHLKDTQSIQKLCSE